MIHSCVDATCGRRPPIRATILDLIQNYLWVWDPATQALLAQLPGYTGNPYTSLAALSDTQLKQLESESLHRSLAEAVASQQRYLQGTPVGRSVAYFCMEFGLDASLPIYSGGLGVLAGDHLKAASDAALPLVAVGLLYHGGYLRQVIDSNGWQHEEYPRLDPTMTGLRLERDAQGAPLLVSAPLGEREVYAQIWRVDVGRVPLYLLDTDIAANTVDSDREITQRLYGGDRDMRIRQEIILGIAGARALGVLGYGLMDTYHLNEGHASFLLLELMHLLRQPGVSFGEVLATTTQRAVFTTHTPMPAGHDRFPYDLLFYYLGPWWRQVAGFTDEDLVMLGGGDGNFSMTELALNAARATNGVSLKHGEVARAMFPGRAIGAITNGVHHPTWTGPRAAALFDTTTPGWREDGTLLRGALTLSPTAIRQTHAAAKRDLVAAVNARYPDAQLNDTAFTIGFARRMTGYKRAALIFRDPARLATLAARGLQIVVAGKAHANDTEGKGLIANVVQHTHDHPIRVVFVEGYDMALARLLVAGVDVWLNNPQRPREASGTSGMKALLNGVPNLSVLDGWWIEGYHGNNGWAIGEEYNGGDEDAYDANSLYTLLEMEILPEFYDHPEQWTARMRRAIATAPDFTAQRMISQYVQEVYRLGDATPAVSDQHSAAVGGVREQAQTMRG